jgi:dienelactone hydrolase
MAAADERNEDPNGPKTEFALETYNLSDWQARHKRLRQQILSAAGLLSMPERTALQPKIIRVYEEGRFLVETLTIETLPGYVVGANLYRPKQLAGRVPAVLIPHGHWKRGRVEQIEQYSVPALAGNLAIQGYVAFTWDMVGYNDTRQTPHDFGGWREQLWGFSPLGLQLWNAIRAVDYVQSRPEVNPDRIAVTGASGGGTQTFLLSAVDERIRLSAPVNMVSAHYQGGDPCEEAPNLRLNGANNVEFTALMAPRPLLLISCSRDWTKHTPEREFPAIRQIYHLFGASDRARHEHFDAPHNYNAGSRNAFYTWLHSYWGKTGTPAPADVSITLPPEQLLAGIGKRENHYKHVFEQWRTIASSSNDLTGAARLREQLRFALGADVPSTVRLMQSGDAAYLTRVGVGDRIPAAHYGGKGRPVLLLHTDGVSAAKKTPEFQQLRDAGRPVLLVDLFQTGRARERREKNGRWFLCYNRSDDAERVQDILTALRFLRSQYGEVPELSASALAATWALFAAAVDPEAVVFDAARNTLSGTDEEMKQNFFVPVIQRAGGIRAAETILTGKNRN